MNVVIGKRYPGCETCDIHTDTNPDFPTLYVGDHWISSIRYGDQTLLGTVFISARRHVPEVDFLTADEEREFVLLRNGLIRSIREAFEPVTFNLSCLKNNALQVAGTDSESTHVHYHLKPRYNRTVVVNGEEFVDPMPGRYLTDFTRHKPTVETAQNIFETIKAGLRI
jgi:diadenosine tetraphosphate (Ap4A) HIT family hydrolase